MFVAVALILTLKNVSAVSGCILGFPYHQLK